MLVTQQAAILSQQYLRCLPLPRCPLPSPGRGHLCLAEHTSRSGQGGNGERLPSISSVRFGVLRKRARKCLCRAVLRVVGTGELGQSSDSWVALVTAVTTAHVSGMLTCWYCFNLLTSNPGLALMTSPSMGTTATPPSQIGNTGRGWGNGTPEGWAAPQVGGEGCLCLVWREGYEARASGPV